MLLRTKTFRTFAKRLLFSLRIQPLQHSVKNNLRRLYFKKQLQENLADYQTLNVYEWQNVAYSNSPTSYISIVIWKISIHLEHPRRLFFSKKKHI